MVHTNIRLASAMATLLVALASPALAADEQGSSSWLGAVGDFVSAGLGPARTMDDIRREEEAAREAKAKAELKRDEVAPLPKLAAPAAPPPPPPAVVPEHGPVPMPVVAAPAPAPAPVVSKPLAEVKKPVPQPAPAAAVVPVPAPRPAVPVAVRAAPVAPPPPEPLTSRIAATATLDQAVKLGGSADLYTRVKKPVKN